MACWQQLCALGYHIFSSTDTWSDRLSKLKNLLSEFSSNTLGDISLRKVPWRIYIYIYICWDASNWMQVWKGRVCFLLEQRSLVSFQILLCERCTHSGRKDHEIFHIRYSFMKRIQTHFKVFKAQTTPNNLIQEIEVQEYI